MPTTDIGWAIRGLKSGKRVRRRGWRDKRKFLWFKPPIQIQADWCKDPKLKKLVENVDDYGFVPGERSKSITIAPPPGGMMRDRNEILEEIVADRQVSYERTKARFEEIDSVVQQFADNPEFIVIRMYYFNEDAFGNDRAPDSRPYTFEEISEELAITGLQRSEKTLRSWRTRLVQDMTVTLFGIDGAVSVETRDDSKGGYKAE